MVWIGLLLPFFNLKPGVSGHSYAIRRRDFDEWGVADVWSRSITTDSPLTALARARGKGIRYVPLAAPLGAGACDADGFFRVFDKWSVYLRLYAKPEWMLAWLFILAKAWLYARAFQLIARPSCVVLLLGSDILYGLSVFFILKRAMPDRFQGLGAARIAAAGLAVPFVQAVYLLNLLRSLGVKEILWGGYIYRVRAPYDIEVIR